MNFIEIYEAAKCKKDKLKGHTEAKYKEPETYKIFEFLENI